MRFFNKVMIKYCVIPVSIFLLTGCNENKNIQKPYVVGYSKHYVSKDIVKIQDKNLDRVEIEKIKSQTLKDIALINKQRDIEVEKLKQETSVSEAKLKKELAIKKSDTDLIMAEKTIESQKMSTILTTIIALLALLIVSYFLYKRRQDKLKMHQDMINKEVYMKDRELQAQMANRLLDTLQSKRLSPEQEAKLIESITKTTDVTPVALIDKKD